MSTRHKTVAKDLKRTCLQAQPYGLVSYMTLAGMGGPSVGVLRDTAIYL